jgi:hypothetical protein
MAGKGHAGAAGGKVILRDPEARLLYIDTAKVYFLNSHKLVIP